MGELAIVGFSRMTKVPLTLYIIYSSTDPLHGIGLISVILATEIIRRQVRPGYMANGNIVSMRFISLSTNALTKVLRNDATHNACLAS